MKIKKETLILLVLIAALSVYLVFRTQDRTHYSLPALPGVPKGSISKIEISRGDASILLTKEGTLWKIGSQGYAADLGKVNGLLEILETLTLSALVSETKDFNRYDLGDDHKIRVRAWSSQELKRDFELGKTAPTFHHTFVRLAGDDAVYQARESFRGRFDQSADDFRDKEVLSFSPGEVREISVVKGDRSVVLGRKEPAGDGASPLSQGSGWESSDGEEGDANVLNELLGDLSRLHCESYLEAKQGDFQEPLYEIGLRGNKEYRLAIYPKKEEETGYPAVSSENRDPFYLSVGGAERIMKDPEELLVKKGEEKPSE
jgi:hypothetical protein